jgi:hypothetical protein
MKVIKWALIIICLGISHMGFSQQNAGSINFHGAEATLKEYKALYILNQSDDKKMKAVLRNINNALEDPRLKGKLKVEIESF